jgi:hypothetical protein
MKRYFVFTLFLFFINIHFAKCQEKQIIVWSDSFKLNKSDFTIANFDTLDSRLHRFMAISSISIDIDPLTNIATAVSIKKESLIDLDIELYEEKSINELINHEQGHFDIAQIFALKMNLMHLENRLFHRNSQTQEIYKICMVQYSKIAQKYDNQTEHGMNTEKQEYWNHLNKSELRKLNFEIERTKKFKEK